MKPTVMFILGTRPEAIKLAPVIAALATTQPFVVKTCSTGQHRQMLEGVLESFGISADIDLDVMLPDQTLATLTSRLLLALDKVFADEEPQVVVVQGDTTSAMAGALAAYYRQIPVVHVEAGLRSGDKYSPFPEEMNRRLISSVASLHFAPTEAARAHLLEEGIDAALVEVTGNTAIDALLMTVKRRLNEPLLLDSSNAGPMDLSALGESRLVLVTAHRRESHETGLASICAAVKEIAAMPGAVVVFPVHLNPRVQETVSPALRDLPNVFLTAPLDYPTFARVMGKSFLILTDSGGIQEEAPSLGVPVLVMRAVTERQEGIDAGNARLVGTDAAAILASVRELWNEPSVHDVMSRAPNPYGDGTASAGIARTMTKVFGSGDSGMPTATGS